MGRGSRQVLSFVRIHSYLLSLPERRNLICSAHRAEVMDSTNPLPKDLLQEFRSVVPKLEFEKHKGQYGRIGVVGGSLEYTGAPFFAGMSSLRGGADLAYIFCHPDAAVPIKSYSPELIVYPMIREDRYEEIESLLSRCHAITIGPGLGRDLRVFDLISRILKMSNTKGIPVVCDADCLWFLSKHPTALIPRGARVVLTPNVVEYRRLQETVKEHLKKDEATFQEVCKFFGEHVIINVKGTSDRILSSSTEGELICSEQGSPRRCGGQGDILSGLTALFTAWGNLHDEDLDWRIPVWAASYVTRHCATRAFERNGRSTLTTDMLAEIGPVFKSLFDL